MLFFCFFLIRITNIAVTGIDAVQHTTTLPLAEPLPLPVVASLPHREPNAFSFAVDASGLDDGVVEHLCRLRGECFHNGGIGAAVKEGTLVRLDLVVEAEVSHLVAKLSNVLIFLFLFFPSVFGCS